MNEISLSDINAMVRETPELFVIDAEAAYDKQLRDLADDICRHASERPITLISGPSGSGKTTTACRLEQILDAAGFESHTLSMDNYFADGTRNAEIVDGFLLVITVFEHCTGIVGKAQVIVVGSVPGLPFHSLCKVSCSRGVVSVSHVLQTSQVNFFSLLRQITLTPSSSRLPFFSNKKAPSAPEVSVHSRWRFIKTCLTDESVVSRDKFKFEEKLYILGTETL